MLFQKKHLPEIIEKAIEEHTIPTLFRKFVASYGQQLARFGGPGFVSGWHPLIPSPLTARYIWTVVNIATVGRGHGPMDIQIAKLLEGFMVIIQYWNRKNDITRM